MPLIAAPTKNVNLRYCIYCLSKPQAVDEFQHPANFAQGADCRAPARFKAGKSPPKT